MNRSAKTTRMLTLAAGTALASVMLGGCATQAAPRADLSAGRAAVALKSGKVNDAVAHAEAAVLAEPHNPAYRTTLGAAYMEAGRFLSAKTSFDDALTLGDESARTALGFALAALATGDQAAALEVLEDWQDDIPAADLGLAFALAGHPDRGALILSNAIRGGDNTPKSRQNLAYALALSGNWSAAKIMAAEDVPADQLDARIAQWAMMARPDQAHVRVAALLGTQAVADGGQPAQLALANTPSNAQLAAEATAPVPAIAEAAPVAPVSDAGGELPALAVASFDAQPDTAPAPIATDTAVEQFAAAFAEPAAPVATPVQMMAAAVEFVSQPVVQYVPAEAVAAQPAPGFAQATPRPVERVADAGSAIPSGDHLVQLGSFSSEAGARKAWSIYERQFPQLAQFERVITKAVVRGKTYYRVSAGGLASAQAGSFCSSAKRHGQGCIAWAEGRPLPGAIASGVRMARR